MRSMRYYRGWAYAFSPHLPVTGRWTASRFGVGLCAGTESAIKRSIDLKIEQG